MEPFNEYGVPNESITKCADELDDVAFRLFTQMITDGCKLSDIRAAAAFLCLSIHNAACSTILTNASERYQQNKGRVA